jgi:hypothetical protein
MDSRRTAHFGNGTSSTEVNGMSRVRSIVVAVVVGSLSLGASSCGTRAAQQEQQDSELLTALQQSLQVTGAAARSFDTSQLANFFVDDPSVPLTDTQKASLARMSPGTPPAGYLTYVAAYYAHWKAGAERYSRVESALRASQRPDPADLAVAIPPRVDDLRIPALRLVTTRTVAPDKMYFEAEGEGILYKVTVVRRANRWLIAGEERTVVGP